MADVQTNVNISDIPDSMKPQRSAILNAADMLVFNQANPWFQATFPSATYYGNTGQTSAPTSTPTQQPLDPSGGSNSTGSTNTQPIFSQTQPPARTVTTPSMIPTNRGGDALPVSHGPIGGPTLQQPGGISGLSSMADLMPKIQGLRYDPHSGYVADNAESFASGGSTTNQLEKALQALNAEIAVPGVTIGPGGTPLGGNYNPVTSGGWTIPSVINTGTGAPLHTPNTGTPGLFPGSLQPVISPQRMNPVQPTGGLSGLPGSGGIAPTSGAITQAPANSANPNAPQQNAPPGMFSSGAAGTASAQGITDAGYNPGQYATDADAQRIATALGGRLAHTNVAGPNAPPSQNIIDEGGAAQLNAGLVQQGLNWAGDDTSKQYADLMRERTTIANDGGDTSSIDKAISQATADYQAKYGKKRGGTIRRDAGGLSGLTPTDGAPNTLGMGSSNNNLTQAPPTNSSSIFTPYTPYQNQRVMGFSPSFGQTSPDGTIQASNLTQQGLAATGNMPSIYDSTGAVNQNSPLGNSWNYIQNAADASQHQSAMANQFMDTVNDSPGVQSSFQDVMSGIAKDPSRFQAGDVNVPQLTAPQLQQPGTVNSMNAQEVMRDVGPLQAAQNNFSAGNLQNYQMGPASQVQAGNTYTDQFGQRQAQQYMSPYQQDVTNQQAAMANRDFREQQGGRDANAVSAGAFGGSRNAVANSLAQRDLNTNLQNIEATGAQNAYTNAQQQFNQDQARGLQSQTTNQGLNLQGQLANQQAGLTVGGQNLGANLATQQLGTNASLQAQLANQTAQQQANQTQYTTQAGIAQNAAGQNLQSQLANQQAGLTAGQANQNAALATQQLGTTAGLSAMQGNQQTRLAQNQALLQGAISADQLGQNAYQANMTDRLASLSQANQAATGYSNTGASFANAANLAQQMALQQAQAQQQAGSVVDAQSQNALNLGYQDFLNQKNDPYQKLNFLSGITAGQPVGTQMEGIQFQKAPAGGLTGLGLAGTGALMNAGSNSNSGLSGLG